MMSPDRLFIRQCMRPNCGFRFPVGDQSEFKETCPKCGGPTRIIQSPYPDLKAKPQPNPGNGLAIEVLFDNIRSAMNVGSMFRTADGAGIHHIHLCGITPTPDHQKVAKTALGAEFSVPWTQHWDAVSAAEALKINGCEIWALEGGTRSKSIFEVLTNLPQLPILLVVGNEVSGVDPAILEICDEIIHLPMQGVKHSLNVAVAFGIAVYTLRFSNMIENKNQTGDN
jgi:23S rRNA (guanosine2251-2'-O)-methyltransferase